MECSLASPWFGEEADWKERGLRYVRHGWGKGSAHKVLRWVQLGGDWGEPS